MFTTRMDLKSCILRRIAEKICMRDSLSDDKLPYIRVGRTPVTDSELFVLSESVSDKDTKQTRTEQRSQIYLKDSYWYAPRIMKRNNRIDTGDRFRDNSLCVASFHSFCSNLPTRHEKIKHLAAKYFIFPSVEVRSKIDQKLVTKSE